MDDLTTSMTVLLDKFGYDACREVLDQLQDQRAEAAELEQAAAFQANAGGFEFRTPPGGSVTWTGQD
jgi:hypothetical protein